MSPKVGFKVNAMYVRRAKNKQKENTKSSKDFALIMIAISFVCYLNPIKPPEVSFDYSITAFPLADFNCWKQRL